jgi:hypothetical protein
VPPTSYETVSYYTFLRLLAETSNLLLVLIALPCRPAVSYPLVRSSLYTVVFAGPKEERLERELENEKREEIGR